jgi:PmbA protein
VERLLDLASAGSLECEIYGEESESFQVEVFNGEVESVDRSKEAGLGVRVLSEGRIGFAWTCDLSPDGLRDVLSEAGSNAMSGDEIDEDVLAGPDSTRFYVDEGKEAPAGFPAESKIEGALMMEAAALSSDDRIRSSEGASYSEVDSVVCVAGTRGFIRTRRGSCCSCSTGAAASSGGEVRSGWSYAQATSPDILDFVGTGREAGKRAAMLLGGEPLPTGRYRVVFDSLAFSEVVSLLGGILSAEMVVRGSSVFEGRLEEKVASKEFTLIDDPFLEGGCFNVPFDDEGVPSSRVELISGGLLKGYLHNCYSMRKTGLGRAGNAFRDSFKSVPAPGPSNLFVLPGSASVDELVDSAGQGIYIQDVMGMHTADPISGDFSIGINGYGIRGGKMGSAVCEMTISGNILSLLDGIAAVGKGIRFAGKAGSPAVLVEGLSVSGR